MLHSARSAPKKAQGYTVTELVSAKALCYHDTKTAQLLAPVSRAKSRLPRRSLAAMMNAWPRLRRWRRNFRRGHPGYQHGRPVGKVVKNGDGSALMKDPEKAARIAEAVVRAVKVPVTAKMRRGWDKGSINAVELAKMLEEVGVSAVAVHRAHAHADVRRRGRLEYDPRRQAGRQHPRHRQRRRFFARSRGAHP